MLKTDLSFDVTSRSLVSLLPVVLAIAVIGGGCRNGDRELAPVSGQVTYQGKPLKFGSVTFQPESGQPATGMIGPDGRFRMNTHGQGDGAAVGRNQVRIGCFENQASFGQPDAAAGLALGRPLIPRKYLSYETSGLVVEVLAGANDPVMLDLCD